MARKNELVVLERQYGKYQVKICFAAQDVPGVEKCVLEAIMNAYRMRIAQQRS